MKKIASRMYTEVKAIIDFGSFLVVEIEGFRKLVLLAILELETSLISLSYLPITPTLLFLHRETTPPKILTPQRINPKKKHIAPKPTVYSPIGPSGVDRPSPI